ncbi:MAG: YoaK family protein [Candidatus Nanopelagicales bacterium]
MRDRDITIGLYLLTAVCGIVDAATFLGLGNVFAEIMTGNLMFLAFRTGQGELSSALPIYLTPLAFFSAGAVGCGYLLWTRRIAGRRRLGFVVVCVLVWAAAILALWWEPEAPTTQATVVVGVLAFAMGMQNAMVLYHVVPDVATNVMTLTLVRLLSNWSVIGGDNSRWHFRVASLATFFAAAAVGAFLLRFGVGVTLAAAALVYVVALPILLLGHSTADAKHRAPAA